MNMFSYLFGSVSQDETDSIVASDEHGYSYYPLGYGQVAEIDDEGQYESSIKHVSDIDEDIADNLDNQIHGRRSGWW